jgi:ABC-type Fe3+ transport system permease subunit
MKNILTRNRHLTQRIGFILITLMSFATVVPIVAVVIYILMQGLPAISWEFLTGFPHDGMRAGGILPAIIGTVYLTIGTAIFSVPLGIAAAIYLSEYASDTPLTRTIRIAIINLAGIPSVRALSELRHIHPGGFTDSFDHDSAGHHQHSRGGIAICTTGISHGQHLARRHTLADHSPHCGEGGIARHSHRRHSGSRASSR